MNPTTLSWEGHEHLHIERTRDWYWALGIVSVSSALTSLLFGNVLFGVLILVAGITLGLMAHHPPRTVVFRFVEKGLMIENELYPFSDMKAFWITEDEHPTLLIDTPRFLTPDVVIPLPEDAVEEVRAELRAHVEERELEEPLPYKIMEMLGF